MKANIVAMVAFTTEIDPKKSDREIADWIEEDISSMMSAWDNGHEDVMVPTVSVIRIKA